MRKIVIAIVIGWVMLFLFRFEGLSFLENAFTDKLIAQTREVDSRIKIVAIDQESLDKIGDWPWSRDKMAALIDTVAANGATAVWPDVLFEESTNPNKDQALAEVVAAHDNVYLPVHFNFEVIGKSQEELKEKYLKLPVVEIPLDRIGHANIVPEDDNVVRRILPGIPNLEEEIIPAIEIRLANLLLPEEEKISWDNDYFWFRGEEPITVDDNLKMGLVYASPPTNSRFDIIPAWKVMGGETDPAYFKDSIVMIGFYGEEEEKWYSTPFGKKQMNSVEIHANSLQAFLDDGFFKELAGSYGAFLIIVVGMFGFGLLALLRPAVGGIVSLIIIAGYTVFVIYYYNSSQLILPYSYTVFALLLAYGAVLADRYFTKSKELKG